jgi:hypothetical protein
MKIKRMDFDSFINPMEIQEINKCQTLPIRATT